MLLMSADLWAGYLSGAASIIVGNPLDLIKVRLQASHLNDVTANRGTWRSFQNLAAGLPAPILTYGALNALLFTTYNRCLSYLPKQHALGELSPQDPLYNHFAAGAVAGFATFFISAPTEYIKCRAQMESPNSQQSNTSWDIAAQTIRQRGVRGLFLGGTVTSLRDAIGYGFWFATYEGTKSVWESHLAQPVGSQGAASTSETGKILLCGGLAGVATWASVFPLDVIKTRVQTQPLRLTNQSSGGAPSAATPLLEEPVPRVRGALELTRQAYHQEGFGVFWRGLSVCCLRAFIVNAVQWSVYEWALASLLR